MSVKRQTLWSMAPLLVVTVLNLVSIPLFYRYLGADLYALLFYVATLSGSFGFADLGLGVAVGRYVGVELGRGDLESARSYWGTGNAVAVPLLVLMALVFMVLGFVFGPRWFNVSPDNVRTLQFAFVVAGFGLFFAYYGQFWNILAQVNLDFRFVSLLRVISSTVQIAGAIVIAALTRDAVLIIAWGTVLSAIQLFALIWHARRCFSFGIHWNLARVSRMREMASYTGKTFLTLLVNNILGGIDRLALGRLAAPVDFAHYTICTNAGQRISGLSAAIMGPIFGQSSRAVGAGGKQRVAEIYEESFDLLYGWLVLVAVWAIVWRHAILTLWLGADLGSAVEPILPPIIAAYCITAMANISGAQLGPLNRVGIGLVIHIIAGALVALCVYLGWHWGGLLGVAYGFLASRAAFVAQDFFVMKMIQARGWLKPSRWLYLVFQLLLGTVIWFLLRTAHLNLTLQLCLALLHGAAVAAWLLRKDIAILRRRAGGPAIADKT
ncbi:MAG: oligosaccharide flippase family protein [Chthoniobacterales bacterium]|nr:oligosaccharide flippase family protein [Chthoniobacterales bacterium]